MPLFAKLLHALFMIALTVALAMALAPVAQAATFTVNSTQDAVDAAPGDGVCATAEGACALRAAIQEANALAGADTINLPAGTYTLTWGSELTINQNLTLTGAGAESTIIQAARQPDVANFRVFHITAGNVAISGVTIRHGRTSGDGGGISNTSPGKLILSDLTVTGNTAAADGGGISNDRGVVTLTNSSVSHNSANKDGRGGGIYNSYGGSTILIHSALSHNYADFLGGGILNDGGGSTTLINSTVSHNMALNGAGIYTYDMLTVTNSTVSKNSSTGGGGWGDRWRLRRHGDDGQHNTGCQHSRRRARLLFCTIHFPWI